MVGSFLLDACGTMPTELVTPHTGTRKEKRRERNRQREKRREEKKRRNEGEEKEEGGERRRTTFLHQHCTVQVRASGSSPRGPQPWNGEQLRRQRFRGQTTPVTSKQGSPEATITKQRARTRRRERGGGWPPRIPPPPPRSLPTSREGREVGQPPYLSFSLFLSHSHSFSLSLPGGDEKVSLCLTSSLSPSLSRHLSFSFVLSLPISFTHLPSLSHPY